MELALVNPSCPNLPSTTLARPRSQSTLGVVLQSPRQYSVEEQNLDHQDPLDCSGRVVTPPYAESSLGKAVELGRDLSNGRIRCDMTRAKF